MTNKLPPPELSDTNITNVVISGIVGTLSGSAVRYSVDNDPLGNDIWNGTAITIPLPPDVGESMSLVSTSIEDAVGGSGIAVIQVDYLDADGNSQTEFVTLDGITEVTMKVTNIRFVQDINSYQAGIGPLVSGDGVSAVGTITLYRTGFPFTVYAQIDIDQNQSLTTAKMVPLGKTLWITEFCVSGGAPLAGGDALVQLKATTHLDNPILTPRLFHKVDGILIFTSGLSKNTAEPIMVPQLAIVKCTSYNPNGSPNLDAHAAWRGTLVDN